MFEHPSELSIWRIWSTIGGAPRETMRSILDTDPTYLVIPLAAGHGIVRGLTLAHRRDLGDTLNLAEVVGLVSLIGVAVAVAGLFASGWILTIIGGWLGGRASAGEVRSAMAWGASPALWTLPVWLVEILLYGEDLFSSVKPNQAAPGAMRSLYFALEGVKLFLTMGSVYTAMKCVGEAFSFSAWRAFFAVMLTGAFLLFLILVVAIPTAVVWVLVVR